MKTPGLQRTNPSKTPHHATMKHVAGPSEWFIYLDYDRIGSDGRGLSFEVVLYVLEGVGGANALCRGLVAAWPPSTPGHQTYNPATGTQGLGGDIMPKAPPF